MEPELVKLNHVPDWLRQGLLRVFGRGENGRVDGRSLLMHAVEVIGITWLENWGSTCDSRGVVFASEPLEINSEKLRSVEEFADRIDVEHFVVPNSWHYPGQTFRIEFLPPVQGEAGYKP